MEHVVILVKNCWVVSKGYCILHIAFYLYYTNIAFVISYKCKMGVLPTATNLIIASFCNLYAQKLTYALAGCYGHHHHCPLSSFKK